MGRVRDIGIIATANAIVMAATIGVVFLVVEALTYPRIALIAIVFGVSFAHGVHTYRRRRERRVKRVIERLQGEWGEQDGESARVTSGGYIIPNDVAKAVIAQTQRTLGAVMDARRCNGEAMTRDEWSGVAGGSTLAVFFGVAISQPTLVGAGIVLAAGAVCGGVVEWRRVRANRVAAVINRLR